MGGETPVGSLGLWLIVYGGALMGWDIGVRVSYVWGGHPGVPGWGGDIGIGVRVSCVGGGHHGGAVRRL